MCIINHLHYSSSLLACEIRESHDETAGKSEKQPNTGILVICDPCVLLYKFYGASITMNSSLQRIVLWITNVYILYIAP